MTFGQSSSAGPLQTKKRISNGDFFYQTPIYNPNAQLRIVHLECKEQSLLAIRLDYLCREVTIQKGVL
jgi:hypothetical protein